MDAIGTSKAVNVHGVNGYLGGVEEENGGKFGADDSVHGDLEFIIWRVVAAYTQKNSC